MSEQDYDLQPAEPASAPDLRPAPEVRVGEAPPVAEDLGARRRVLMAVRQPTDAPDIAAFHAKVATQSPEQAAKALAPQRDLAFDLQESPRLAEYMAQDPQRAALAKDDVPALSALEAGFADLARGLLSRRYMADPRNAENNAQLAGVEEGLAKYDREKHGIIAETVRMLPTVAAYGSVTTLGGLLTGPGGALAAPWLLMYETHVGELYRRMQDREMELLDQDPNYQPRSDEELRTYAKKGAIAGATIFTALGSAFIRALPGVNSALQRLGINIVAKAGEDTLVKAAVRRIEETGAHALSGAMAMAGQAVADDVAVRKATEGKIDLGEATAAGAQAFKQAFGPVAILSAIEPGRAYLRDRGRILDARVEASRIDKMAADAKESKLLQRAPDEAEPLIASMAAGSDAATVYVDAEAVLKDPKIAAAVEAAVGSEALAEARTTQGDVAVPVEKYLARLAFEQHQQLREDVKLSPEGLTLRQAAEVKPDAAPALEALPESQRAQVEGALQEKPAAEAKPSASALRDWAAAVTEGKRLGDLQPGRRRLAADNLARKAAEAGAKSAIAGAEGAPETPGRALNRLQQIAEFERGREANAALAKAEAEALAQAEKDRKFLLRYATPEGRAELGKAAGGHLEQADLLLSGFELGQGASRTEVARREATMAWIALEQSEGRDPYIPDSVLAKLDRFVHWKELTPGELGDLRDAVASVARQAELKNTILTKKGRIDAAIAQAAAVDGAFRNMVEVPIHQKGDVVPAKERAARGVRASAAVVIRPEELVRRLDAGDVNGPFSTYFWHPLSEAYDRFLGLQEKWSKPIVDVIGGLSPETRRRWRTTTFTAAGRLRTMEQAIVVALNWGNASNRFKLLEGYSGVEHLGIKSWTQDTVEDFLSHLNRDDWKAVEKIGLSFEAAWPEIAAHEKSLRGVEPPKVKAEPFTRRLPDGTSVDLQGWYYPIIYDPQFPSGRQSARDAVLSSTYYTATTPQGRLKARVEDYARPLALTLDALPRVIRDFAKDTAMREAVISANSFITHPDIVNALGRTVGEAQTRVLQSVVRDSANDLALPQNGAEVAVQALATLRGGVGSAIFSWNIAQYLQNFSGFAQTLKHVPTRFVREAVYRVVADRGDAYDFARRTSGYMAGRRDQVNADAAQALRTLQDRKSLPGPVAKVAEGIQAFSELGVRFWASSDTLVSHITWRGAYEHARAPAERGGLGLDAESAVRQADRVTRLALGSGRTLDLPAFLRHPVLKLIAPFQSWSSAMFNDYMASSYNARQFMRAGEYGRALREFQGTLVFAGLLGVTSSLLTFRGPKDKDGDGLDAADFARWLAIEGLLGPATWVPYVGPVVKSIEDGREIGTLPYMRSAEVLTKAVKTAASDKEMELEDYGTLGLRGLEAIATVKGAPVTQLRSTFGYLLDENVQKQGPVDVALGVAAGKPREGKLIKLLQE